MYTLLLSIATFSFKKPTFFWQNTNINDLCLLLSFLFFVVAVYKRQLTVSIPKRIVTWFLIGLAAIVVGTGISVLIFHTVAPDASREYARIIGCLMILVETYIIGTNNAAFVRNAIYALIATSVLLPLVVYASPAVLNFFLDESKTRFTGLLSDPNYFATLQILPTFLLFWMSVHTKHPVIRIIFFFLFSLSVGTVVWTGSRGGVLGLFCGMVCLAILSFWKLGTKKALLLCAALLTGWSLIFFVMPNTAHEDIATRITGIVSAPTQLEQTTDLNGDGAIAKVVTQLSSQQGRFPIWKNALKQIARNPLGYGPGYGNVVDIQGANDDHHRVAHNTVLQTLLTGGIILLVTVAVGGYTLSIRLFRSDIPFNETYYLYAALIGILIAAVFLDSLWSRWIWLIISLITAQIYYAANTQHVDR